MVNPFIFTLKNELETQTQIVQPKTLYKKVFKRRNRSRKPPSIKQFKVVLKIPASLQEFRYFSTKFNIQFSLQDLPEQIGELSTNVFTIGSQINQMQINEETIVCSLSQRMLDETPIEIIIQILQSLQMWDGLKNISSMMQLFQTIKLGLKEQLVEIQNEARQYPYESYIVKVTNQSADIVQYTMNHKFLQLMGITVSMMQEALRDYGTLPCAIRVKSYLDTWNLVFGAFSNSSDGFETEIQNYNGQRKYVKVRQRQMFLNIEGENYIFFYWIYDCEVTPCLAICNQENLLESPPMKQCSYKEI